MEDVPATMVLESALLTISIEPAPLAVLSVPNEFVPKCAWLLMRQYSSKSSFNFKSFHSILSDDDGLSIICPAKLMSTFKFLLNPTQYTVSSSQWRAFIINLAGSYEFPGMVFCLADSLSKEGLSILHISTFEAEVVLVQEHDLERACAILREFEDPQKVHRIIEAAWQREAKPQPAVATLVAPPSVDESDSTSAAGHEFDESWLTPQVSAPQEVLLPVPQLPPPVVTPRFAQGFTLCVLPNPVILAKLRDDVDWNVCGPILTSLLLFDERYCPLEKHVGAKMSSRVASQDANDAEGRASRSASDVDARRAQYMWGMWHQNREITFLLDERDVDLFPKDALVTTPQQWRVIKLCGRPIAFNETGVVSAMSKIDANIASLNISTATTNCTLVPEELLEATVQKLSSTLGCPIKFVSVLS